MIEIDGSHGEGGGQMLRTSLALSMATGKPFRIFNLRANRKKPGLKRQHLTCVRAAAEISGAQLRVINWNRGKSCLNPAPSSRGIIGSTSAPPAAPCWFFKRCCRCFDRGRALASHLGRRHPQHDGPAVRFSANHLSAVDGELGPSVSLKLLRRGFYPVGGGLVEATIQPAEKLGSLTLLEREQKPKCSAKAIVSQLPEHIAERELDVLSRRLPFGNWQRDIEEDTTAGDREIW